MTARDLVDDTEVQTMQFALPTCPICRDFLFAPTASALVSERNVRHVWACETCGHGFVTSVRLPRARHPELRPS